jgi:SAM-dependent methyltransferase
VGTEFGTFLPGSLSRDLIAQSTEALALPTARAMAAEERFTNRAPAYHAHRPRYPAELISLLRAEAGLTPASTVADIGSGTGISAQPFLRHGNTVFAIEPNPDMRALAEQNFRGCSNFRSIAATAEATTLPDASVDLIVAGQAFHWFDRARAAAEFARILRPAGWIVLVWNERLTNATPFAAAYERLLIEHSIDYTAVDPKKVSGDADAITTFLGPECRFASFPHRSRLTLEELIGLLASASYAPVPGHPKHPAMIAALEQAFQTNVENGTVPLDYEMKVYYAPRFDPRRECV